MPTTYEPIATATGTSITFSSIPSTYTDLKLIVAGTADFAMRFNSDGLGNYSRTLLEGNGSAASSIQLTNTSSIAFQYQYTSGRSFVEADIFSYAGSTYKTVLSRYSNDNNGSGYVTRAVNMWRSTSAITDLQLFIFGVSATATLYGILKA